MPFNLTAVPAALVEEGQDVLIGDIRVLAGTRVAKIPGLTSGVFANAPHDTLFGNLFTEDGPMRPFGMDRFIGAGLQYTTDLANGPFPEAVTESDQAFPSSSTTMTVVLPTPAFRDRYIVATQHNGSNTITTPSGWTLVSHAALADSDVNVYELIVDQAFLDAALFSVDFVASVAGASLAKVWLIRYGHISLPAEVTQQLNTSTGGTSNDVGALTPSWGTANTLWLTFIGIEADDPSPPNITAFPGAFIKTGELQNASATASLDGAIGWGQFSARSSFVDPGAYVYAASRSAAFIIGIPPRVTGAISVVPGGGTAGWDDVLLVDNHSGASNPIIDDAQYLQFGIATPPVSGQIRTNEPFEARGDKNMDVTAGEDINLIAFDSSQFRVTAGGLTLRAFDGVTITSDDSSVNATAFTTMLLTSGGDMTLTPSGILTAGSTTLTDSASFNAAGVVDINSGADVVNVLGATGVNVTATTGDITLTTSTKVVIPTGFLQFGGGTQPTSGNIRSNNVAPFRVFTLNAMELFSSGYNWINASEYYLYTNLVPRLHVTSAGAWELGSGFVPGTAGQILTSAGTGAAVTWSSFTLAQLPTQATDTFLGNVSGSTATPTAINLSTLAGAGLVFGTHTLDVTAGAGGSIVVTANDVQRGALTGAITASQDSNATSFGNANARTVLVNATNASAQPTFLQGTTAFQHLRVNSAGTGLEWALFTSGDFPSNVVPITALATIATDTLLANTTAGTATPTAVAFTSIASTSIVWDATTHKFQLAAASGGDITRSQNSVTYTINNDAVTYAKMQNVSATSRFLGRITAGAGDPEELTGTQATTLLDVFTSLLKGVVPASGGGTTNFLRADGTWTTPAGSGDGLGPDGDKGDITVGGTGTTLTIDAGVVTSAKMANMSAKSVKANATNASAVPTDLAGSAAFQHLRVNSGNTGLEWSVFTSGDFPAGVVPLTAYATQAANTIVANATAGVASPTAVTCGAESVFGQTSGNLQGIASSVQTALIRGSGSVFWGAAAADQVLRRSGSGDLGFGTLVTNNIGNNQVTLGLMAQVATARLLGRTTAATGNVEALTLTNSTTITWNVATGGTVSVERAALTGDVTASANSNATTIATGVVSNAKLATAAANTLKGNITGSTASPTDNDFSTTFDALAGNQERTVVARSATGWDAQFQTTMLAFLNLPTTGGGCTVQHFDENFDHYVVGALGGVTSTDAFIGITNGSASEWSVSIGTAGGTVTVTSIATTAGHHGIIQCSTDTTSGHDCTLFHPATVRFDRTVLLDFWVKLSATTSETVRIGMMQDEVQTSGGTDSAMFQFDPAVNANWQCISRLTSGTAQTTTTAVAGSTLWKKFTIWRESSTSLKFYINNTLVATHSTLPAIAMAIFVYIKANAAGGKSFQVDRIRMFVDDATLLT